MFTAKSMNTARLATAPLLLTLVVVVGQFGCSRKGPEKVVSNPNPVSPAAKKSATISRVSNAVYLKASGQTTDTEIADGDREIQDGDAISTDNNGEACLAFGDCNKVYIYQRSRLVKAGCSKMDAQAGNTYCGVEGTSAFKDCASNLILESASAIVSLEGTWVSTTFLPDKQFTLLIVFDGSAKARPVLDQETKKMGEPTKVPALHFWFTAPDNKLKEIAALQLHLDPRTAYPLERLPELLSNAGLNLPPLKPVAEQAVTDAPVPAWVPKYFPPYGDPDRGPGAGRDLAGLIPAPPPTQEPDLQFDPTKIGRSSTKAFGISGNAFVVPASIRIQDPKNVFKTLPDARTSNATNPKQVSVVFNPATAGDYSGELSYRDTQGRRYKRRLLGHAAAPELEMSSKQLTFNAQDGYVAKVTLTSKTAVAPVTIGNVSFKSNKDQDFTPLNDTCSNRDLAKTCEISIRYNHPYRDQPAPTTETDQLIISHDDPHQPRTITLNAAVNPIIEVPNELTFESVNIGGECEESLRLINHGPPVTFGAASIVTGSNPADFSIVKDTCKASTVTDTCEIAVAFKPQTSVPELAALKIPNGKGSLRSVQLYGLGRKPPLSISMNANFGVQKLGSVGPERTLTISNVSGSSLQIKDIQISGPNQAEFKINSDTCKSASSIQTCEVRMTFAPVGEGSRRANLLLFTTDNKSAASTTQSYPIVAGANIAGQQTASTPNPNTRSSAPNPPLCVGDRREIEGTGEFAGFAVDSDKHCFRPKIVPGKNQGGPEVQNVTITSKQGLIPFSLDASLAGKHKDDFQIDPSDCKTVTGTCSIAVRFVPLKANKRQAVLILRHGTTSPPIDVELLGEGKSRHLIVRAAKSMLRFFGLNKKQCK